MDVERSAEIRRAQEVFVRLKHPLAAGDNVMIDVEQVRISGKLTLS